MFEYTIISELLKQVKMWIIREASTEYVKNKFLIDCRNSLTKSALIANKGVSEEHIEKCLSDAEALYEIVINLLDQICIEQIKDKEIIYH